MKVLKTERTAVLVDLPGLKPVLVLVEQTSLYGIGGTYCLAVTVK